VGVALGLVQARVVHLAAEEEERRLLGPVFLPTHCLQR
tara:strand:- start:159 stop:272 length:114 start_codon:yes stop_codon:yes gene_type:complete